MQVPFDEYGNLQSYPQNCIWRDCYEFRGAMRVIGIHRGRSAAHFILEDSDKYQYPMFMVKMLDVLKRGRVSEGVIRGKWSFCKGGQNYSLCWMGEE